jgi:hypothetical protein
MEILIMKKLTALTLSAAMVPALALGTVAFASQSTEGTQADEQGIDDQGMERAGEQDDELRSGEQDSEEWGSEEQGGDEWGSEEQAGEEGDQEQLSGQQGSGEQFMSRKPAGALYGDDVIGKSVKLRSSGDDIGEIEDLVIGEDGRVLGAVVTTGGFLGLGGQEIGVGWDHMQHSMEEDDSVFYVDMDEESLQNAPELERD